MRALRALPIALVLLAGCGSTEEPKKEISEETQTPGAPEVAMLGQDDRFVAGPGALRLLTHEIWRGALAGQRGTILYEDEDARLLKILFRKEPMRLKSSQSLSRNWREKSPAPQ